ncbi:unnamed protein product [Symbiodinium sp. CCMP2592]|nr:unnamed protein product [Symbiodinium sp. CCMP2592]
MGELNQWSTLMLSLPMTFQVGASPEKLYFAGVTARENYGTGYDLLFRSAVQRIYELGVYRDSQPGKLTHKEIAARWKASVTFSTITDADETMQDWAGFVSTCISVYDRCLSNPTVSRLILDAEERWGKQTPWDSVGKLDTLCSKCTKSIGRSDPGSATDRMCWVIRAVHDFYDSEQIQKTQLSTRNFSGKGLYGHKGTCDILLYKYGLGIYIKDYLEGTIIDANQKAVIRSVFDDHESYRKAYGQHGHMEDYDVSWLGSLCQPARTACGLLKQLVYTVEEDARLKRMLHAGASCADWLDHDELSEKTGPLKSEMLALSSLERAVVEETPVVSTPQQKMQDSIVHTLKVSGSEESMESHVRSLPEADLARIMEAITYAKQHVRQFIKLFVDDEKEKLVLDALNESSLTRIAKSEFLLTCFDVKNSGEPVTCPHIRVAPLKNERLRRCIQRTCKFMSSPDGLPENMAFMVFDGGKFGNLAPIMSQFVDSKGTAMPKQTRTISICYEENSVIRRMERYRTMTSLQQLESCHLVYNCGINLPGMKKRRNRCYYSGTSHGQVIQNVVLPTDAEVWTTSFANKKAIYDRLRVDVGGTTAGGSADVQKRTEETIEPVNFHSMPLNLYREILEVDTKPNAILDWTVGDSQFATVALECQISYVGACFSETHQNEVYERLTALTLKKMQTEGSGMLYRPYLAELLSGSTQRIGGGGTETTSGSGRGGPALAARIEALRREGASADAA